MRVRWIGVLLLLLTIAFPLQAGAHASLVQAVPEMNALLADSPAKVSLTFNERLEDGAYYIKVYDTDKKSVTQGKASMNGSHTALDIDLPKLPEGDYIVTYHVISADGHPVDGTYLFTVGQSRKSSLPDPNQAMHGMHHNDQGGLVTGLGLIDYVQFALRIIYYMALLAVVGGVIWSRLYKPTAAEAAGQLSRVRTFGLRTYLIAVILLMFVHLQQMVGDAGAEGLAELFTRTGTGTVWLVTLALALLAFVVLGRSIWFDMAWAAAVILAKCLNGHAAAFEPVRETVALDFLHLAAASVWVGGIVTLLALLRKHKGAAAELLPKLSSAAFGSIAVLIVSGFLSMLLFLPNVTYVLYTGWGRLLLVKMALTLLVVVTAAVIRLAMRKRQEIRLAKLVVADAVLMTVIVAIVGVFTFLNPLPQNKALNYHVMGEKQHMTVQISPNAPGTNHFVVKVWLPEPLGKPKQLLLRLHDLDDTGIAPIEVPLAPFEDKGYDETYGMKRYSYQSDGSYLPYAGNWNVEVRVMDSNDDEKVYEKQMRIY